MPVWGEQKITWRQVLPPVLAVVAVLCLALALRNCIGGGRTGVSSSEQYEFYAAQLDSADAASVAMAIKFLGNAGDKRAIEPVRAKLSHSDPRVVGAACGALGKLGDAASAAKSMQLLGNEAPDIVAGAVEGLGALAHKPALDPLVKLLDTPDTAIRTAVFTSLGQLGDRAALKALEPYDGDAASGLDPEPTPEEQTQLTQALSQALASLRSAQQ